MPANTYQFVGSCNVYENENNTFLLYVNVELTYCLSGDDDGHEWKECSQAPESHISELKEEIENACTEIIENYTHVPWFHMYFNWYEGIIEDNTLIIENTYSWNLDYIEYGNWGAPIPVWEATTCDDWKSDWDVTIGGLFHNMTKDKFFGTGMFELDNDDCEEILNTDCNDF